MSAQWCGILHPDPPLTARAHANGVAALDFVLGGAPSDGPKWIKKALEWANIVLGSLGGVPVVGTLADSIQELKESVEAQADDDQSPTQ